MSNRIRVLIIEDQPLDAELMLHELRRAGFDPDWQLVSTERDYRACLESPLDVILADYRLPQFDALRALEILRERELDIPLIIVSGSVGEDAAVAALKEGAADYLLKDRLARLGKAVESALQKKRLRDEKRRAELELRESEEKFRQLAENIREVFWITSPDLNQMIYASPAYEEIWGMPLESLYRNPRQWLEAICEQDRRRTIDALAKVASEETTASVEYRIIRPDGSIRWIQDRRFPIRNQEGQVYRVTGLAVDMTENKLAEMVLEQQLERISLLNQIARAIAERQDLTNIFQVVLKQLEERFPIDHGSIFLYEESAKALTAAAQGLREERGFCVGEIVTFEDDSAILKSCLMGESAYLNDTALSDETISEKLAECGIRSAFLVPLMAEGRLLGILVTGRRAPHAFSNAEGEFLKVLGEHVSLAARQARLLEDLQRAYDDLRQTQQAVMQYERLRALGQMASGIVHDISNAISPVTGYAELLLLREPGLSPRARQYLETIKMAGADVALIVARLREFYRQRSQQDLFQPVDFNSVVQQALELTRPRWKDIPQSQGIFIQVTTDLQEGAPAVWGVEAEIREALTNLIFNAVDAMPRGGTITIRTRHITRPLASPGLSRIALEVSDTGTGMNEQTRQRCLEPFFSTKGERGTGMGLAMVYGIMQRHGGEIEIESEPGRGTTVRLLFPISQQAARDAEEVSEIRLKQLRVLCIDDEPLLRALIKDVLEQEGHLVQLEEDGASGVAAFRASRERGQPFDLVITDLGMPKMNGREVAHLIKQISSETPVILLTGWGRWMESERPPHIEIDALLSKPPSMNTLRKILQDIALEREDWRAA
jgi:PAS domain S-box-containing protein